MVAFVLFLFTYRQIFGPLVSLIDLFKNGCQYFSLRSVNSKKAMADLYTPLSSTPLYKLCTKIYIEGLVELSITKGMAACTFYQKALRT